MARRDSLNTALRRGDDTNDRVGSVLKAMFVCFFFWFLSSLFFCFSCFCSCVSLAVFSVLDEDEVTSFSFTLFCAWLFFCCCWLGGEGCCVWHSLSTLSTYVWSCWLAASDGGKLCAHATFALSPFPSFFNEWLIVAAVFFFCFLLLLESLYWVESKTKQRTQDE